jgi:hypothetical protein
MWVRKKAVDAPDYSATPLWHVRSEVTQQVVVYLAPVTRDVPGPGGVELDHLLLIGLKRLAMARYAETKGGRTRTTS